jgi:hypothetical protein
VTPDGLLLSPQTPDYRGVAVLRGEKSTRVAQVPTRYKAVHERALSGSSRKAAVRCMCLECMGWNEAEVHRCTDRWCPLWKWRERG